MTRHLIPVCLWLVTLLLAVVSATATPRVSVVHRHALQRSSGPLYADEHRVELVKTLSNK